jgi:hypothetical protein
VTVAGDADPVGEWRTRSVGGRRSHGVVEMGGRQFAAGRGRRAPPKPSSSTAIQSWPAAS